MLLMKLMDEAVHVHVLYKRDTFVMQKYIRSSIYCVLQNGTKCKFKCYNLGNENIHSKALL